MTLTSLARLAVDTGGRFTENSNDLTLGYARARRDLDCVYSLGFYVDGFAEDRIGDVTVRVLKEGLRAIHPSKYVFRSRGEKRESMLRAAWISPEMFQTGVVRAHIFPMRPASAEAWDAVLAVSFEVSLAESHGADARREFGAVLMKGPSVVHRFARTVTLTPDDPAVTSAPEITFLQRVRLTPGSYTLTTVLSEVEETDPHATRIQIGVPEILERRPFLVGPLLGRPSGSNIVVTGGGAQAGSDEISDPRGFQPLLVQQIEGSVDLVAFTQACVVGDRRYFRKKARPAERIDREVRQASGGWTGEIDPIEIVLDGDDTVRCGNLVDVIPASGLPAGEYEFEAQLRPQKGDAPAESVRFSIGTVER